MTATVPPVAPASPAMPWRFLIIVFIVAIAVSVAVGYLGATGHLGWGIPGTTPP